jgi:hypothetical protein
MKTKTFLICIIIWILITGIICGVGLLEKKELNKKFESINNLSDAKLFFNECHKKLALDCESIFLDKTK